MKIYFSFPFITGRHDSHLLILWATRAAREDTLPQLFLRLYNISSSL
jgi:hypothetical protein